MRLRAIVFALAAFAAAGAAAWRIGEVAVARFERATIADLDTAFAAAGQRWARAGADGLVVTLEGEAPDETSRFKAREIARALVDDARIVDATTLAEVEPLPPAPFALELLRNEDDVSLIGLVPETGGRDVIRSALGAGGLGSHVTDMLESADEPAPDGWVPALGFGLAVLAELPRAKISVNPGRVAVIAVADTAADRADLEARLERAAPKGVALDLGISAPKAVIAPFAFDLALAAGKATLGSCSAGTAEAAATIVAAARAAGLAGEPGCAVGLGAPSPDWAKAVVAGIAALRQLGGGRFVLSDIAATLTGPDGVSPEALAAAGSALDAALPDVFQLTTVAAPQMTTDAAGRKTYAPRFDASLAAGRAVHLAGPVKDAASREAVASYAAALFGHDRVTNDTVIDPDLPDGWPVRLLAGLEALAALDEGSLQVTTGAVRLEGSTLAPEVPQKVAELLQQKVGRDATVGVRYDAAAAEAASRAAQPRPELCAEQIDAILAAGSIQFARGSADIVPESRGVIGAIADVLRGCPGADFEIGGHTDSQGSAEGNRRLSEARAQAVLAALRSEDLPNVRLTARGFGADDPVGDNATDAGRARNRRIEFTLVAPPSPAADIAPALPAADAANAADDHGAAATADCVATLNGLVQATPIEFEPGASTIAPASAALIGRLGDALSGCPEAAIEIGGHTDSQGSESGNLRLSTERATAVLDALRQPDLPLANVTARGYGEADPVADNATEAGRAKNRRIAFTVTAQPEPKPEDATARAAAEAGSGDEPVDAPAEAACAATAQAAIDKAGIAFEAGSSQIAPDSKPVIAAVAAALGACPDAAVEIGGHTDSTGSESGNQRLSQARADAVLAALRAGGPALPNATAKGYGESRPIADNGTAEGRARNRRIAVTLVAEPAQGGEAAAGEGSGDGSE